MKKINLNKKLSKRLLINIFVALVALVFCLVFLLKNFFSYAIMESCFSNFTGLKIEFQKPKTALDYKPGEFSEFPGELTSLFPPVTLTRASFARTPAGTSVLELMFKSQYSLKIVMPSRFSQPRR